MRKRVSSSIGASSLDRERSSRWRRSSGASRLGRPGRYGRPKLCRWATCTGVPRAKSRLPAVVERWIDRGRRGPGAVAVVPARSLSARAGASESGALRMTVHGLYPAVPAGSRLLSVWLDLVVPSPDPSSPAPIRFAAWSYASRPVPSASPETSFVLPNGGADGVTLLVETLERPFLRGLGVPSPAVPWDGQTPPQGTRRRYEGHFHVSGSDGRLPLRRGVYLLGLTPSTWHWAERLPQPDEAPRAELLSVAVSVCPEGEA